MLAGGALAVAIERPEDLRFAGLLAMAGDGVRETPPPPALLEPELFYVPTEQALGTTPPSGMPERTTLRREELAPPSRLIERMHGYTGGNLRPTPWGAAASYGLGEVHFLAFPIDEHAVTDRWVQLKLVDLTRHAWERQAQVALPLGQNALDDHRTSIIRKVLDPNENMRWTIVVSAVVLLLYAGLAGPLNFYLAARKGRPLRAVLWLPVWAMLTMFTIVAVGIAGKGVKGVLESSSWSSRVRAWRALLPLVSAASTPRRPKSSRCGRRRARASSTSPPRTSSWSATWWSIATASGSRVSAPNPGKRSWSARTVHSSSAAA